MTTYPPENCSLDQALVEAQLLTDEQVQMARSEAARDGVPFDEWLVDAGLVAERDLVRIFAEQRGLAYVDLTDYEPGAEVVKLVDVRYAERYGLLPLSQENGCLTMAVARPLDMATIDDLTMLLGQRIKTVLACKSEIANGLRIAYGVGADTILQIVPQATSTESAPTHQLRIDITGDLSDKASIIRFVNQVLVETYRSRATDVHIEPFPDQLRIRYRVDGVLHTMPVPPNLKAFHEEIISRIKVMSHLNIAERRLPQDGRFHIRIQKTDIDLRVSILPTAQGETVGIRFLDPENIYTSLDRLGMDDDQSRAIGRVIGKPYGILFVTGPTGSGKTTTLYACLNQINTTETKIITIEDPIEYQLAGITQVQVHPKVGLTFSSGLRSMLRHDPDVMMVGEVRDTETAQIAIRVSLTGHLVFSSVHTNNAVSTIARLINMGIEPYLIASSVECVVAQRLIRIICPHCKEKRPTPPPLFTECSRLGLSAEVDEVLVGTGCPVCSGTGYYGRTGIFEIMMFDDELREAIIKGATTKELTARATENGMTSLRYDGLRKVINGVTTIEEVLRVTQESK